VAVSKSRREAIKINPLAIAIRLERIDEAQIRNAALGSEIRDTFSGIVKFRDVESMRCGAPHVLAWQGLNGCRDDD
jgi:hypothetical protein